MTAVAAVPRASRRQATHDFKRQAIVEAARAVFAEAGLEGATIRAIAKEAGYVPGALYLYYDGKEEIYAEIISDSLSRLAAQVKAAVAPVKETDGDTRARAGRAFLAFFTFYAARPDELALGLYLLQGGKRRGLTPALDRRLNGRLIAVLQIMADALAAHGGLDPASANFETVSLASHIVGCLIMEATGRLKILGHTPRRLVEHRLAEVLDRTAMG